MNKNINYLETLINDEANFTQEQLCKFQDDKITKDMGYWSTWKKFDDMRELEDEKIRGKKECYIIYEGVQNRCYDGYHIRNVEVVDKFEDIQKYMIEKNELLCHIWYFNYDKATIRMVYGDFDEYDRVYIKEIEEKFYFYDILDDDFLELSFDSIEEAKEYYNNWNYKKYVKLYDSKEELRKFYE